MKNDLINEYREVKDKFEDKILISRILDEIGVNKHIKFTSNIKLQKEIYRMITQYLYDLRDKDPEFKKIYSDYKFNMDKLNFKCGDITFDYLYRNWCDKFGLITNADSITLEKLEARVRELNINEENIVSEGANAIEANLNGIFSNIIERIKADMEKTRLSKLASNIPSAYEGIDIDKNGSLIYTRKIDRKSFFLRSNFLFHSNPTNPNNFNGIGTIVIQEEDSKLIVNKKYDCYSKKDGIRDVITSDVTKYDENDVEMERKVDGYRVKGANKKIYSLNCKRDSEYPFVMTQSYDYEDRLYNEISKKYDKIVKQCNDEITYGHITDGCTGEFLSSLTLNMPELRDYSIDTGIKIDQPYTSLEIPNKYNLEEFYNSNKESILNMLKKIRYSNLYEKVLKSSLKNDLENFGKENSTELKSTSELGKETMAEQKDVKAKERIFAKLFHRQKGQSKENR